MQQLSDKALKSLSRASLLEATSDIAVVLDKDGVVLEMQVADVNLARAVNEDWRGRRWVDTATVESRAKIEEMMCDAAAGAAPRWRQISHHTANEEHDLAVRYCMLRIGKGDRYLGIGRDLSPLVNLQQQLIEAQQTAEQDYWRLRQAESKFRVLFQASEEAVLVVNSDNARILEANPAAQQLLNWTAPAANRDLWSLFDSTGQNAIRNLLARAESAGQADLEAVELAETNTRIRASASLVRQGNASVYLLRMRTEAQAAKRTDQTTLRLLHFIATAPDAVLVTDDSGMILYANQAFVELAQLASPEQALGASLANWVGRTNVEFNVLMAALRKNELVRSYAALLNGSHGVTAETEISARKLALEGADTAYGFVLRDVSQRAPAPGASIPDTATTRSIEELTDLVGRVPLKELVRESADLIERLSIEAALKLTGDNRAAAAEMLGLSRQSLYVKLRRYDIGDQSQSE